MRTWKIFVLVGLLALGISAASADYLPLRSDVAGERPDVTIPRHDADQVQMEIRLPGVSLSEGTLEGKRWDRVEIPGGARGYELGAPEVPHFTRLLVIPSTKAVRAEFEALETTTLQNIELMPAQEAEPEELASLAGEPVLYDMAAYSRDAFYPDNRVMVGEPAVMRGLRVVALRTNPVQYNPVRKELRIATRYRVTVHFEGADRRNVPKRQIPLSRTWANMMRGASFNFDELNLDQQNMGSYLIVCVNNATLLNNLQPLVDWKRRKGHTVAVLTFAPGSSNTTIKSLIQNAYNTWPIPPEYVLLFGDTSGDYTLPTWSYNGGSVDHQYSQLDGGDILADVALGRLPATDATKTLVLINKVLFYEKMPFTTNADWYHQGVLVAGSSASGVSTIEVNRWIKTRMIWNGFTRIDTLWYTMGGSVPTVISNAINNGVTYVNYRGWIGMEGFGNGSIDALTNGRKMPYVTTITCGTGGWNSSESVMEHFVSVGTPTTPKGAIAAVGTATSSTHTRFNNTIDGGIYAGVFDEGLSQPGTSLNRGKLELYNAYQLADPGSVNNFSNWAGLAGDPGLELFTSGIQYMNCNVPAMLSWGVNSLSLTVSGALAGATVCAYQDSSRQSIRETDGYGQVTLPLTGFNAGNVKVTITMHNYYPIVDSLDLVQAAVTVGYYSHSIDDDSTGGSSGDNDGIINPGEVVQIPTVFKNYGSSTTATGVSVSAAESDPFVVLSNSTQTFPNLAPGATGNSSGSFLLSVAASAPHGHVIPLMLNTTTGQGSWPGQLDLSVVSYDLNIRGAYASGSDSLLSPGETANFILIVQNAGGKNAGSLTATLTSLSPYVTVNDDSAGFGTVGIGAIGNCSSNPFNLTASAYAPPGHPADLALTFSANGATQDNKFTILLGSKSMTDPQGPDQHGYYCFDNTDLNYPQHPTYSWVEINPGAGGSGTQIILNDTGENLDASALVLLPFLFRFYGQEVDTITVCSNGWISPYPDISFNDFRNYPIPSAMGPVGQIAPFWDDLVEGYGSPPGHVYKWYDSANHRYIIEWFNMKKYNPYQYEPLEKFEVILFDPAYYPTPTSDGEIIFQYNNIEEAFGAGDDNGYSTVGIERQDYQDGIEVVYWATYDDPAAAHLANGRAYKFTTNFSYTPPASTVGITLTPVNPPIQIPANGGNFSFDVNITNNGASPANIDAWIMQKLPNGSWQGPMIGPVDLLIPPAYTIARNRHQNVPGSAMPGMYYYIGYVGVYSSVKLDSSYFTYTKLSAGDGGSIVDNWSNYGESFDPWLASRATGQVQQSLPERFALKAAYPNPFNPAVTIPFELPQASHVKLAIYDIRGSRVATLVDGMRDAGRYEAVFDGSKLSSGVYLYRLTAGGYTSTQKIVLMK